MNFRKKLSLMLLVFAFFFAVSACSGGSSSKQDVGQMLYQSGCNNCHDNTVICLNLGKDATYWNKTVTRMAKKVKGKKVNIELLVKNLQSQDKNSEICK